MPILSNNAKFVCVTAGIAAGIAVSFLIRITHPVPEFEERLTSMKYDAKRQTEWREHAQAAARRELAKQPQELCRQREERYFWVRDVVSDYYRKRAEALVLARQHLAAGEAERVRLAWDGAAGRPIEDGIVNATRAGALDRADFRGPIAPELAELLARSQPVAPICTG